MDRDHPGSAAKARAHGRRLRRLIPRVVGARELKTRLGRYLRWVREERTVLVTDRGEPIAELRPVPADTSVPAVLLNLSSNRAVTLPVRKAMGAFRPIQSRRRALSDAIVEDHEDRF